MKHGDTIAVALILYLLWKWQDNNTVIMCYVDPDTGECLPVEGA